MSNFIKYGDGHWSVESNVQVSLEIYLKMYEDVYNKTNLERVLSEVPNHRPLEILDYGGGVGMTAVALALRGHDVTLVDASSDAINAAQYYAKSKNTKINTLCLDNLDDNRISETKYDVIIAKDLIEHVINDEALFYSFFAKLKPKGLLIASTQNSFSPNYFIEKTLRKLKNPNRVWMGWDRTHLRFYNPQSLARLCEKAGFSSFHFNSGYIFPYKLLSILFPWFNCQSDNFAFRIDRFLSRLPVLRKIGWNLMIVCHKE